jgi:branched-chain amino acid transport system permease protein
VSGAEFIQTLLSGMSLGGLYAVIALGFVIVYSASEVLSFFQAAIALVGAYLAFSFGPNGAGMPFVVAVLAAAVIGSVLTLLVGEWVVAPIARRINTGTASIATVGVYFIFVAIVSAAYGVDPRNLGDPWGLDTVSVLGAAVSVAMMWTIAVSAVLAALWLAVMKWTRLGLATRSMVSDREAAVAQGVRPSRVIRTAWATAGATGVIAGVFLATGSGGVNATLSTVPFLVLPAVVLGGLRSPLGAVVGGMIMGVLQQFVALLQPDYFEALGSRFAGVVPFLLLFVVLLVRPRGLFGARQIARF